MELCTTFRFKKILISQTFTNLSMLGTDICSLQILDKDSKLLYVAESFENI